MKTVVVSLSEGFGGYHITDPDCPNLTNSGCHCEDANHDIAWCFEEDQRAIVRLGLPDMEHGEIREMKWRTPLSPIADAEGLQ